MSFVRRARRCRLLELSTGCRQKKTPVVAKDRSARSAQPICPVLNVADAVMVARGDLAGVEMRPEEVPIAQKNIIRAAAEHRVVVIRSTQMLESMIRVPLPEASDVANAIFDGTDANHAERRNGGWSIRGAGDRDVHPHHRHHRKGSDRYREQRENVAKAE